jgi:demethylmenaquinone methyltransferase/2-methoxy-6-polyprenyl-1,4-benzoquinol methylase
MFDRIARRYDRVNTVLSIGTDGGWRRRAARETRLRRGGSALDVACGSGKLTAELTKLSGGGRVVGLDFSPRMLEIARRDHPGVEFVEGDALNLPFDDASFDASTIAFGLRNLADPVGGLREMVRVARRAVVLEFVRPPRGFAGGAYRAYLRTVLPAVRRAGRLPLPQRHRRLVPHARGADRDGREGRLVGRDVCGPCHGDRRDRHRRSRRRPMSLAIRHRHGFRNP